METFAKSILNYFATFTETRFNFGKKLAYRWSDDTGTLDLCIFPGLEQELLDTFAANHPLDLQVGKGQHAIRLDAESFRSRLLRALADALDEGFLASRIDSAAEAMAQARADQDGEQDGAFEREAQIEGMRQFCMAFRREVQQALASLQEEKRRELAATLGTERIPGSSFNPRMVEQGIYDDLVKLTATCATAGEFHASVRQLVETASFSLVMYDLFLMLSAFLRKLGAASAYLFFHDLRKDEDGFPLFAAELEIDERLDALRIRSAHDVFLVNVPAINYFRFDSILTVPRAALYAAAAHDLAGVERFLQDQYGAPDAYLLKPRFSLLDRDGGPSLAYRIGVQAVKDEDRKILDYSELITHLGQGGARKFIDLITTYVGGNVKSTADAVDADCKRSFPPRSVENLVTPQLPVPVALNRQQKKILKALEHDDNRILVVDGPPGTGKSHTITALVYLANARGKTAVVTSHKRQALDVIDSTLTEQFRSVHPRMKPAVLRLSKARNLETLNDAKSSLSQATIAAARRLSEETSPAAVEADRDRQFGRLREANDAFWEAASSYGNETTGTFELELLHRKLFGDDGATPYPPVLPADASLDLDLLGPLAAVLGSLDAGIPLSALVALWPRRAEIPDALEKCEQLSRLGGCADLPGREDCADISADLGPVGAAVGSLRRACDDRKSLALFDPQRPLPSGVDEPALRDVGSLREAEELVSLVGRVAESREGVLRRLFRRRQAGLLEAELASRFPACADACRRAGHAAVATRIADVLEELRQATAGDAFLAADYLLASPADLPAGRVAHLLRELTGLRFAAVRGAVCAIVGCAPSELTLAKMAEGITALEKRQQCRDLARAVAEYAELLRVDPGDLPALHRCLRSVATVLPRLTDAQLAFLARLFDAYAPLLALASIREEDVASLSGFASETSATLCADIRRYVEVHASLSAVRRANPPRKEEVDDYLAKVRKLLDHQASVRFKGLQNHAADVQRVLTAIESGKRLDCEQARLLLTHLSCIVAEPDLLSRHFPMEEDIIDLLIIDEASQVSIAESISLILRAKQTVVFGDELQYGAVGAVNVTERYAAQYFREILRSYASACHETIPEEEQERLAAEASRNPSEEEEQSSRVYPVTPGTREWLKTFSIRTSTLSFAKALANYTDSLNVHFRSFPEIIGYSNRVFYQPSQIDLVPNRIRTKPIQEVFRFLRVESKGNAGDNVNLDEIEAVRDDLAALHASGYRGSIGVVCSFKEQTARMRDLLRRELPCHPDLVRDNRFAVWFVGDVQGEERDTVYYSFVEDRRLGNASLKAIYPAVGGTADSIHCLKMQRLNVGFSRAKDTMVFVHSMPLEDYADTRLGDALLHYRRVQETAADNIVESEDVFESPAELELYRQLLRTPFYQANQRRLRLIAQFEIGKYIREEFHRCIPGYRVDFLLTLSDGGRERSLILEYDGVEYHTKHPETVTAETFDQEYLEYDTQRQAELESYGYRFLRINKFTLTPSLPGQTRTDVLNALLERAFG